MPRKQEVLAKFNLVSGEDTYASQTSQNPATSRRLQSLIPAKSGLLTRELGQAKFLPTQLPTTCGAIFQYDYNDATGAKQSKRLAATATALYMDTVTAWTIQTLPASSGGTTTAPFSDYPQFAVFNNLLHFGDGVNNYIYDGVNNAFVFDGFAIPLNAPGIDTSTSGTFSTSIGRYYWFTFADLTTGRVHESSSSAISASTGVITSKTVKISPSPGTVTLNSGSAAVTGIGTAFQFITVPPGQVAFTNQTVTGLIMYVNGVSFGVVSSVTDATHLTLSTPAPLTITGGSVLFAPARATNINIYASETDGSKLGKYLGTILVTANPPVLSDQSPFINQASSTILDIDRPVRNDPAPSSKIIEVHKSRLFRRRESKPSFFNFTANEEVASGNNGSPQESVPGASVNTLSDIINEDPYPKPSNRIRALKSHGDALYIGTEKDTTPLYGDSIDSFGLSQVTAISNGIISRWGMESTSHGLVMFTYDRKMLLYPPISPAYSITPENINITDQLQEIGLAMRNKFLTIKNSDQDNVRVLWYNYGSRNWLVTCYQDNASVYHTYVFDFETKGWLELQRGVASLAIFEPTIGQKILVGGGTDGFVYVLDDPQGIYTNATLPSATWRTALIDFGHPDMLHIPDYLEYEVKNAGNGDLSTSITVNFYLDPTDADNVANPIPLSMSPVPNRANLFRGFFAPAATSAGSPGTLCKRLMIEFLVASDTNAGSLDGVMLKADPVSNLFQ
jgi:hypothetical protein